MRKFLSTVLAIVIISAFSPRIGRCASDFQKYFEKANELYKQGKYEDAAREYQKILDEGYRSTALYYNLGNAYYRMNKTPDAILFYERAKKLDPSDEDIKFNLNVANLKIVDKIEPIPKPFIAEWARSLRELFSEKTWAFLAIAFDFIAFAALVLFFASWKPTVRKIGFFGFIFALFFAVAAFYGTLSAHSEKTARDEAIVFSPSVYVKSSPNEDSPDLFILHEGTKVKIIDEVDNWKKIKIADGHLGWLPSDAIEII